MDVTPTTKPAHENPGHRWISLTSYGKKEMGYLVPLDEGIPFVVKRIFYLTDIPNGVHRGRHAYYETKQVLICVSGEVKVKCQEGEREVTYYLKDNKQGVCCSYKLTVKKQSLFMIAFFGSLI